MIARALTIAGSDSGGGAGIQADLKTFMAFSVFGMSAITAITVQDTQKVYDVQAVNPEVVAAQITVVVDDMGVDAIKIGMLFSRPIIEAVVQCLKAVPNIPVVLDPVMRSKGGAALLSPGSEDALRTLLVPRATVITPNLPESAALAGFPVTTRDDMVRAAEFFVDLGVPYALIKGGHLEGDAMSSDFLLSQSGGIWLDAERVDTRDTHGTGCTLSSAIAAGLARGQGVDDAIMQAKTYVTEAIKHAPGLGHGHGPLMHHWGQSRWI